MLNRATCDQCGYEKTIAGCIEREEDGKIPGYCYGCKKQTRFIPSENVEAKKLLGDPSRSPRRYQSPRDRPQKNDA